MKKPVKKIDVVFFHPCEGKYKMEKFTEVEVNTILMGDKDTPLQILDNRGKTKDQLLEQKFESLREYVSNFASETREKIMDLHNRQDYRQIESIQCQTKYLTERVMEMSREIQLLSDKNRGIFTRIKNFFS